MRVRPQDAARCRHRIEASGVPGMAAGESRQREPPALDDTEALNRLERVLRAARVETAARTQQRAQRPLIGANQERGEMTHCSPTFFHSATRHACSALPPASRALARALTTRSTAGISR